MKLLIVDDHPVLREGLAALLSQAGTDTEVLQVGNAQDAYAALDRHHDLDIVVLDLVMPGVGGLTALAEFGRIRPDLPVVVLSASEAPQDARQALAQGALAYVPKSASPNTLLAAIRLVLDGEVYVPPMILNAPAAQAAAARRDGGPRAEPGRLTERQTEVLRQLGEGRANKDIALALALSEKTVKVHVTAIFKALGVVNRTQAVNAGRAAGLI